MSGPKINRYTLSPEARENLDEQTRCDRQSLIYAKRIKKLLHQLLESRGPVREELSRLQLIHDRLGGCEEEISVLEGFLSDFDTLILPIETALRKEWPVQTQTYTLTEAVLQQKKCRLASLKDMLKSVRACGAPVEKALADAREVGRASAVHMQDHIASSISHEVSFALPRREDAFKSETDAVRSQLNGLLSDAACPKVMKVPLKNALQALEQIGSPDQLRTFRSVTVDPLAKRYTDAVREEQEALAYREELTERYLTLCELTGTEAASLSCEQTKEAITRMEQALMAEREQAYVAACLDEVMTEMGYDLIGCREVTKKSGRRFRSELYTFAEGTAVNVTYSSDGQIAMELGGIARTDRLPTEAEADALVEDMESFCADFAEIERRLALKGVIPGSRIAMAPPSAEYAAIINVADYDTGGRQVAEMQVSNRQKTEAVKKSMHRGDE